MVGGCMKRQKRPTRRPAGRSHKGRRSSSAKRLAPRTAAQYFAMSAQSQDRRTRLGGVVSRARSTRTVGTRKPGGTSKHRPIPLSRLSDRSYAARDRGLHVLAAMRADPNLTPTHAAKLEGVSYRTLKKYFGSELKRAGNRYYVTPSDRRVEYVYLPDEQGNIV